MKNIIIHVIWLAAVAAGLFMGLQKFDAYLRLKALGDCGMSSRYETTNADTGVTVSYPVDEVYKACLQEKGY